MATDKEQRQMLGFIASSHTEQLAQERLTSAIHDYSQRLDAEQQRYAALTAEAQRRDERNQYYQLVAEEAQRRNEAARLKAQQAQQQQQQQPKGETVNEVYNVK